MFAGVSACSCMRICGMTVRARVLVPMLFKHLLCASIFDCFEHVFGFICVFLHLHMPTYD